MNTRILYIASLALSVSAHAKSDDQLRHDMQLTVSKAYSECRAYYEIVVTSPADSYNLTAEDARAMQNSANVRSLMHAANVDGIPKGRRIADSDFTKAKTELADLAESNPAAFEDSMAEYRKSCRMAVNDPRTFVDKTLRDSQPRKMRTTLPKNLTAEMILKNGKPTTGVKDISKCSEPAVAHTFSLDSMLVEGGMVCTQHQNGVCQSEHRWMSYRQFIEARYPDRTLNGYSEKLSITFEDGKQRNIRTITACLIVPELQTRTR